MPEPRPPTPGQPAAGRAAWTALALLAAVAAAYQPVWRAGLVWDDDGHVTPPALQSVAGLRRIWFEANATQQYYPVLHSAFWVEHRLWGDAAAGYHLLNLALHAAAAFLLYRVLRRLAVPGAAWAAGLFALHPVAVESVAWIAEQKNTLSAVCYFAAALAYLHFDRRRTPGAYAGAFLLFLAALGSKTVTATLPGALLVVFWWQRGRLGWRRDVRPLLPWFGAAAAAGAVTAWMERTFIGARGPAFALGPLERLLLAARIVWFYLAKLCWPHPLIFIYPRWRVTAADPAAYLCLAAALAVLAGLYALRRRSRAPLAAALLYGGALFPALGFINVFPFIYSYVADHFQYLASAVFCAALAAAASAATRRWGGAPRAAAAALVLLGLGALTFGQARDYRDAETLWLATLARNPGAAMADQNLGGIYLRAGRADRAVPLFQRAVSLHPDDPEARNELGVALLQAGRAEAAERELERALAAQPDNPETHVNLGVALLQLGRTAESTAHFERARALAPHNLRALQNLAAAAARAGDWSRAAALYQEARDLEPAHAAAEADLAQALLQAQRPAEAARHYRQALALQPDLASAHQGLAQALFAAGDLPGAEAELRARLAAAPADPGLLLALGTVLGRMDRWAEAGAAFARAVQAAPGSTEPLADLAAAHLHQRQPDEAAACYEAALRLEPGSAPLHNGLGICRAQEGRPAEAAAEFARALAIDPGFEAARRNLERARAAGPP